MHALLLSSRLRRRLCGQLHRLQVAVVSSRATAGDSRGAAVVQAQYSALPPGEEAPEETTVSVAGRVMTRRVMGKLAFVTLRDDSGTIQLYVDKSRMEEGPDAFKELKALVDAGDFVGVEGGLRRTDRGELSVVVKKLQVRAVTPLGLHCRAVLPPVVHCRASLVARLHAKASLLLLSQEPGCVHRCRCGRAGAGPPAAMPAVVPAARIVDRVSRGSSHEFRMGLHMRLAVLLVPPAAALTVGLAWRLAGLRFAACGSLPFAIHGRGVRWLLTPGSSVQVLTKSHRAMPDKFHGLVDVEKRYRQRYVDLIANPEVKETFRARSIIVSTLRRFLEDQGFLEVETPVWPPCPRQALPESVKTVYLHRACRTPVACVVVLTNPLCKLSNPCRCKACMRLQQSPYRTAGPA